LVPKSESISKRLASSSLAGDANSVTLSDLYTCTTIAFTANDDDANLLEMDSDFGTNLATTKYDMAAITDGTY
jgi:hypothetical protein